MIYNIFKKNNNNQNMHKLQYDFIGSFIMFIVESRKDWNYNDYMCLTIEPTNNQSALLDRPIYNVLWA